MQQIVKNLRKSVFALSCIFAATAALADTLVKDRYDLCNDAWKQVESGTLLDYLHKHKSHNPLLSQTSFLGYSPGPFHKLHGILDHAIVPLYESIKSYRWATHKTVHGKKCNNGQRNIHYSSETPLTGKELEKAEELKEGLRTARTNLQNLPEEERINTIISGITVALGTINYEFFNQNDDPLKTLPELLTSGTGDCEDFALSRYTMARELGINPDHLALVFYLHPTEIGHVNLAIYKKSTDTWVIVDGTGRNDGEEAGFSIAYENSEQGLDLLRRISPSSAQRVPVMVINHKGFLPLNAFNGNSLILEPPQALSKKNGWENVWYPSKHQQQDQTPTPSAL